jgi:hypothetical protein
MWREFDNWKDFPTVPVACHARPNTHWFDQTVNRYAERFLGVVMAGAPFFYVALFLAYLAVSFGIIS